MSHSSPWNFATFSLVITALGPSWEQLCTILNKQLGISSCQKAPFGAWEQSASATTPSLSLFPQNSHTKPYHSLLLKKRWRIQAGQPECPANLHIPSSESKLLALLPPSKHPMQHHAVLYLEFFTNKTKKNRIE